MPRPRVDAEVGEGLQFQSVPDVRAADLEARLNEELGERAHAGATDTDEMN
jgi:hypothetical protein